MGRQLVIIGAGGFGREVFDVIEAINGRWSPRRGDEFEVLGFLDDAPLRASQLAPYGVSVLGPVAGIEDLPSGVGFVIGIGNPQVRASLDGRLMNRRRSPVLVHPSATIARNVEIGPGTVVCAGARLTNHITLGRHVHVNLNSTIGHDARLDDYVTLSPLVAISGNVHAGKRSFFGTGAKVNPGVSVGSDAVIGTGAAVIKNVEAGTTVVGVPAKPRG